MKRIVIAVVALALGTVFAAAQDWPTKLVKIIVPFAAGATPDVVARLIADAEVGGFRQMIAVIGDSANAGSIELHRAAGFRMVGTFDNVGFKFGRWLDSVLMQRPLGTGATAMP